MRAEWMQDLLFFMFACMLASFLIANLIVGSYGKYTYDDVDTLPSEYAALVLGTSKWLGAGRKNLYYQYRIEAALTAYKMGKCKKIIVSGDNRSIHYNEPMTMKRDLMRLGVPEADIICDYAGTRTLDSIIRFKEIFGQDRGIVISQKFHNSRAIYIARHKGIELIGFNARDVDRTSGIKTRMREVGSKLFAVLDVIVFDTQPRHLGDKINI